MLRESSFLIALGISLIGHASLFVLFPSHFHSTESIASKREDVEIAYFKIRELPQWGSFSKKDGVKGKIEEETEEMFPSQTTFEPMAKAEVPQDLDLKVSESSDTINLQEMVQEPSKQELSKVSSASQFQHPVFLTYYQGIRENIRKAAKRRYHGRDAQGDISLGFTLFSTGKLKEVGVLKGQSKGSALLQNLAVQSLLDASPFPPFPEILDRDQISFVIVLSFGPKL